MTDTPALDVTAQLELRPRSARRPRPARAHRAPARRSTSGCSSTTADLDAGHGLVGDRWASAGSPLDADLPGRPDHDHRHAPAGGHRTGPRSLAAGRRPALRRPGPERGEPAGGQPAGDRRRRPRGQRHARIPAAPSSRPGSAATRCAGSTRRPVAPIACAASTPGSCRAGRSGSATRSARPDGPRACGLDMVPPGA